MASMSQQQKEEELYKSVSDAPPEVQLEIMEWIVEQNKRAIDQIKSELWDVDEGDLNHE